MALRFLNSGYFAGKVGIGTASGAAYTLDVLTSDETIANFKSSNAFPSIRISGDGTATQHPLLSFRNGNTQVGVIGVDITKDILTFVRN